MMGDFTEEPLLVQCEEDVLFGIVSRPRDPLSRGVLIVVGGPQYRVGSHRQFTLLARQLAESGIASLRFDYRGMGDGTGEARTFESVVTDIRCAVDALVAGIPGLKEVVIWGLCDAASAALLYAGSDSRVTGLVLANPWVRTTEGIARAHLRHYYVARLFQWSLWQKVMRGEFRVREAILSLGRFLIDAFGGATRSRLQDRSEPLPVRMEHGLRNFKGGVLLILSGNDLTAQEFKDLVAGSRTWQALLEQRRVTRLDLPKANHTFAQRDWRDQVARQTAAWVKANGAH